MIEELLPAKAVAVEAFDDLAPAPLFPAEEQLVARAVQKRRREFATARRCAREALSILGHRPAAILPGERNAPIWPVGIVGSITHCVGYRAAAVAANTALWTVGVDAEPAQPLPNGVLFAIANQHERSAIAVLRERDRSVCWDRLMFCAKEAVYKAWFPLTLRWLDFEQVVVEIDVTGRFEARLLVDGPAVAGRRLTGFSGRWLSQRGLLITAVVVPR